VRLAVTALVVLGAAVAQAQTVELRVQPRPHFVDDPLVLQIVAEDFEPEPEPTVSAPDPAGGKLELVGVQPDVRTQIEFVNGRITRSDQVRFVYQYRYRTTRPGRVTLGPFVVEQGDVRVTAGPVELELETVPLSDRLRVELELPRTPVYPGERVALELQVWIESGLRERLAGYTLRVPLFDRAQSFRFLDTQAPGATTEIEVQTLDGTQVMHARAMEQRSGGLSFLVLSIQRTLVPLRAGRFEIEAPSLYADEATRWQRDLFGRRRSTATRKLRTLGRAARLEVRPVPERGRPASFSGAVGRAFELDVRADRSVVGAGEPIALTLTLRGDGNLESASLPPLDAPGLLPPGDFQVPEGQLAGTTGEQGKEFTAVVRARHENVQEIPALEFSWFDPESRRFETTRSRPVALAVGAAQRIGASDVVRGEPAANEVEPDAPLALTGADLAIERRPERLLGGAASAPIWVVALLHVAGLGLLGLAWADRQQRAVDPVVRRRRRVLREAHAAVRGAAGHPDEIASQLRRMRAELPDASVPELDDVLARCDALRFARDGERERTLDDAEQAHALEIARQLEGLAG
jgi:hypothetical protein